MEIITKYSDFLNENINTNKITVTYKRVSEFGDRKDLYTAFVEKLSKSRIKFIKENNFISFNLYNQFSGVNADFKLLVYGDTEYGNYILVFEYNSTNSREDIIDEFSSTFDRITYTLETEYEEDTEPFYPSREFWIKKID
jgi:hypothetical protein